MQFNSFNNNNNNNKCLAIILRIQSALNILDIMS
jgi:hypothetical protein